MADQGRHLWGAFCLGVVAVLELLSGRQDCVDHVINLPIVFVPGVYLALVVLEGSYLSRAPNTSASLLLKSRPPAITYVQV